MHRLLFVLVFLCQIFLGCNDGEKGAVPGGLMYFDLKTFFENEKEWLKGQSQFSKTVTVNGNTERQDVQKIDFENDIDLFVKTDINRPSWSDKYSIDSTFSQGNELVKVVYRSTDPELSTKSIEIDFKLGEVESISIESGTKSRIAETKQVLRYTPKKGYSIKSFQDVATISPNTFEVEVLFK